MIYGCKMSAVIFYALNLHSQQTELDTLKKISICNVFYFTYFDISFYILDVVLKLYSIDQAQCYMLMGYKVE